MIVGWSGIDTAGTELLWLLVDRAARNRTKVRYMPEKPPYLASFRARVTQMDDTVDPGVQDAMAVADEGRAAESQMHRLVRNRAGCM